MTLLDSLTALLFAAWAVSELGISLLSLTNQLRGVTTRSDRLSFVAIWLALALPLVLAALAWRDRLTHPETAPGTAWTLLGYGGCALAAAGIAIRVGAVITLRRQFTTTVAIVDHHQLINTGLYRHIRHPAYLGLLLTMAGLGLAVGNLLALLALIVLPLAATLYRIHVEERALLRHFGPAYQAYAARTKRLLPGIY
jgi:protein-S-isoprenylcysteine O-methyltransferase